MFRKLFGRSDERGNQGQDSEQRRVPQPQIEPEPTPALPATWSTSGLIYQNGDGDLSVSVSSVREAKLVKRDAKLRQKELRTEKRALSSAMQEIRARYRQKAASRGPSIRGGGTFGKVMRTADQYGRSADRSNREQELAPYESAKSRIDHQIYLLDRLVNTIDAQIHTLEDDGAPD